MSRAQALRRAYRLEPHPEGGAFAEAYTANARLEGGRFAAGSIYFLLEGREISHLHQIDCEELWYFYEGCGMRVTAIDALGHVESMLLGFDLEAGQRAMIALPAGVWFAAENLDAEGYTFVSCATSPKFRYEGFRLIGRDELHSRLGENAAPYEYLIL